MGSTQEQALGAEEFRKKVAVLQVNLRGRSFEEADCHRGGTSCSVPTGGKVGSFRTSDGTHHAATSFFQIWSDQQYQIVNMMGPYDPAELLDQLIEQLEKGREFTQAGGHTISDAMMISKGITLLE